MGQFFMGLETAVEMNPVSRPVSRVVSRAGYKPIFNTRYFPAKVVTRAPDMEYSPVTCRLHSGYIPSLGG